MPTILPGFRALLPAQAKLKVFILAAAAKTCARGIPPFNARKQLGDPSGFVATYKRFALFAD